MSQDHHDIQTSEFYQSIYRIRRVEEEIAKIYPSDDIKSPVHLSTGQESIPVGVCQALEHDDVVFGTYRSHALFLAKTGDLNRMMAELYGKITGVAKGKGGSMHLVDTSVGMMGTSAIVSTTIPQAIGYAYALKLKGSNTVVASFFGDGAVEEGVFHESLNFASLKKLPIIFICENNRYAIHSHQYDRQLLDNLCDRVHQYGIPAHRIEDSDVRTIYEWTTEARKKICDEHQGPQFLESMTYRWMEHVGPNEDFDAGYRSQSDIQIWLDNDQVEILSRALQMEKRKSIEEAVEEELQQAIKFAEQSPFPDDEELYRGIFKDRL